MPRLANSTSGWSLQTVPGRMLAHAIPSARLHLVEGKGHFSLLIDEAVRYLSAAEGAGR